MEPASPVFLDLRFNSYFLVEYELIVMSFIFSLYLLQFLRISHSVFDTIANTSLAQKPFLSDSLSKQRKYKQHILMCIMHMHMSVAVKTNGMFAM